MEGFGKTIVHVLEKPCGVIVVGIPTRRDVCIHAKNIFGLCADEEDSRDWFFRNKSPTGMIQLQAKEDPRCIIKKEGRGGRVVCITQERP